MRKIFVTALNQHGQPIKKLPFTLPVIRYNELSVTIVVQGIQFSTYLSLNMIFFSSNT